MGWGSLRRFGGALALSAGLLACGGGSDGNNDHGIVFRAVSFVRGPESIDIDQIRCTPPDRENAILDTAWAIELSRDPRWYPDDNDPFLNPCGGYIVLENNLSVQALNVQFIEVDYSIPGAAIEPPSFPISTGVRINPATTEDDSPTQGSIIYLSLESQMIPADMMTWLEQNQNLLPTTPYSMTASFTAVGQSDSSDVYRSNTIDYQFTISR